MLGLPCDHIVKIYRYGKEVDKYGDRIEEIIFEGLCNYQQGGSGNTNMSGGMLQSNPRIYIEEIVNGIMQNDEVLITTPYGNSIEGMVEQSIVDDFGAKFGAEFNGIVFTKVWLVNEKVMK